MNLLPQDVLIMIKLAVSRREGWTYNRIAHELDMSPSMAHSGVKRATTSSTWRTLLIRIVIGPGVKLEELSGLVVIDEVQRHAFPPV